MTAVLPSQLKPGQFIGYPPKARRIAQAHVDLLRLLPLSFEPLLLRELIQYDWKFPAERKEVDSQFTYLVSLSKEQLQQSMARFAQVKLSPELERLDWINTPGAFSEQLSAHLWATHQIDSFRAAAKEFVETFHAATPLDPLPARRLGIVVIGQGVAENPYPLFRKLRRHGVYYNQIKPENGRRILLDAVAARIKAHPVPFGHWYVDGGVEEKISCQGLACVSYHSLDPVRAGLLERMRRIIRSGSGPEQLRSALLQMRPEELGLTGDADDAVLNRFQVSVLTEGSGTQFFSTTFVQWAARELLRRAQPLTLLARFAPRQTGRSMNEMLADTQTRAVLDPLGSLIDADMGRAITASVRSPGSSTVSEDARAAS